ncbi:hypothetical protein KIN20_009825 [Parelaphostrongylus tenuis]|uniref:Uncharacterized protein n=1 Tax=Parelaphostrongylus tenuis TaxID=148309 RepID=A0AAD5QNM5_PARTN|nr:hypothetical protein KIN20_009825 [Parelaphostrongylus tenuis]
MALSAVVNESTWKHYKGIFEYIVWQTRRFQKMKLENVEPASRPRRAPTSTSQCSGAVCEIVTD